MEIVCPICLTQQTLPTTLPFGRSPRCCVCDQLLVPYRSCPACELAFDPEAQACPTCGVCPPVGASEHSLWGIPDRLVLEALASVQQRYAAVTAATMIAATSVASPTRPPETIPSKPLEPAPGKGAPTNGVSNGHGRPANGKSTNGRSAPGLPEYPSVTVAADKRNGSHAAAPALPPGLQRMAAPANGDDGADSSGALFVMESSVSVKAGVDLNAEFELIQEPSRLAEVISELSSAQLLAVDTETTGLDPFTSRVLLVQVGTPERTYVVDATRVDPRPLRRILEDDHNLKLLQNAKFDYKMLRRGRRLADDDLPIDIRMRRMYDTMLAERVLTAGISREIGLAKLSEKYAGLSMDKSIRSSFINSNGEFSQEQLRYAARDVLVLFTIYAQQTEQLKRERLVKTADLEFRTLAAVGEMELAGCLIDQERWRTIIEGAAAERDRCALELGEMLAGAIPQLSLFGGPGINLNSNAQLIETFGRMGIVLPDTMEATLAKYSDPAIKKLLEYRGFEKTLSAFGEKFLELINKETGRIHPDFNQLGADTGRFSCANPNVQQIPATSDFRSCFVAGEGRKLITCDYSQAELRILAQLSEDPAFVEAFCSGGDLHQLTASQMFQVPPDQVTKQMRGSAKVINFGLAYGRGATALGGQLGVSPEDAKKLIEQYFKAYSGIQRWLDRAAREAVRKGFSITMLGRKRFYPPLDPSDPEYNKKRAGVERQGKNSPIQGCLEGSTRVFEQSRGYVSIAELEGQHVKLWDGERFARAMVVATGKKCLVKIDFFGGQTIHCSPDHRFLVRDPNGRSMWKTPVEFMPQHRVILTNAVPDWRCEVELPDAVCDGSWNAKATSLSQFNDPVALGEWLGRLASDGSVAMGATTLMVAEHEEAILPRMMAHCAQLGHVGHRVRETAEHPRRFHYLTVSSRGLAVQLVAMGIKEQVPACAWHDCNILRGYLRGMFDGDGTVHPDGAILTFGKGDTHLGWAREIQQGLLLLGITSRVRSYEGDRTVVQVRKKDMPRFVEQVGFINPLKHQKASQITGRVRERTYGRGVRVREVEVTSAWVDMYDVVNSETERFMANGLVVHNSNADMTKLALIGLNEALQGYDARVVNTVHDEIVVEARADQAEAVCKIVEHEMVAAGEKIIQLVPVVADAKIADYWSK